ncbi:DMT family transporter [Porticoccus sp. W117]|uniref:DMT family transporter n=1 Tax=Porticoccus sp. W117 TaxID=3054777 RepID=UPI002594F02E|nr:DMT family transporter [Porticoccus sp. W117]MDM3869812.1 DMT family transporter [Porticoccus sp. W117]
MTTKNQKQAFLFAIGAVLLWSTVATAFKITLSYLTPVQMVFYASAVSALALLVISMVQGKLHLLPSHLKQRPLFYLGLGLLNPLIYYLVLFKSYDLLPASQAQPLNYTWAIALTLLSVPFLGQKIRNRDWQACGLGYFGVVLIATQGNLLALKFENPLGVMLALLSTLLWASYWIINTRNSGDPVVSVLLAFLLSLPFSAVVCGLSDGFAHLNWQALVAVSYVGLFEMGVTFVLWLMAMKKAENTSRISNLIFISPFISLVLLATVIGETIHLSTVAGLLLIVCGLLIQNRSA